LPSSGANSPPEETKAMRLGLVTYNLARAWDVPTIIERCRKGGFEGVELRTTHAHGVESALSEAERRRVREQFEGSGVRLVSLGLAFEYHQADPDEVRRHVEGTKEYTRLAHDVGAVGVKVRPNGFPDGVPREKTIEQIGRSVRECAGFAEGLGVQIWLEVHGRGTCELEVIRQIMDVADHPNARVCWNSNMEDVKGGTVRDTFSLVRDCIGSVHINELYREEYPWRELFALLRASGYSGYCFAEVAESSDPERLMQYYRALWRELSRPGA
jgi:sugar phosphate isomerase/epimerase